MRALTEETIVLSTSRYQVAINWMCLFDTGMPLTTKYVVSMAKKSELSKALNLSANTTVFLCACV